MVVKKWRQDFRRDLLDVTEHVKYLRPHVSKSCQLTRRRRILHSAPVEKESSGFSDIFPVKIRQRFRTIRIHDVNHVQSVISAISGSDFPFRIPIKEALKFVKSHNSDCLSAESHDLLIVFHSILRNSIRERSMIFHQWGIWKEVLVPCIARDAGAD
jgi:hypothetical protein